MKLTWDRISPTQLNCNLETGGLSNAGRDRSSERRRRGRSDPSEGYASLSLTICKERRTGAVLRSPLRRCWSGGETKSHGHDFRCHYLSLTGGFRGRRFKVCQLYLCLRPLRPPPLQPRLELRPICSRYFEALGAIMMPSHDIGVQGRALCSDRRSTCDCSRGAASRYLVGSSPRLTRSTAHRAIACGVSCHSPRRISCGVS
jgi:hypothetical protein